MILSESAVYIIFRILCHLTLGYFGYFDTYDFYSIPELLSLQLQTKSFKTYLLRFRKIRHGKKDCKGSLIIQNYLGLLFR